MIEMDSQGRERTEQERRLIGERVDGKLVGEQADGKLIARMLVGLVLIFAVTPIWVLCVLFVLAYASSILPVAVIVVALALSSAIPLVPGVLLVRSSLRAQRRWR